MSLSPTLGLLWVTRGRGRVHHTTKPGKVLIGGCKGLYECPLWVKSGHAGYGSNMSALPPEADIRRCDFTGTSSDRTKSKPRRLRRHRLLFVHESSKAYGVGPTGPPGIQTRHGSAHHS